MKILDATCGFKGMWYQKNHPFVTFMDKRKEKINIAFNSGWKRTYNINPNGIVSEWKDAPFPDNYFDMVIFDPPHLIWKNEKKESALDKEYGYLYEKTWKQDIKEGTDKLFRILKPEGVFILKWCEQKILIDEILKLIPYKPLFGTRTGQANKNHWIVFIKHRLEQELDIN